MKIHLPSSNELSDYYKSYLKYVRTDDLLEELRNQHLATQDFFKSMSAEKEVYRYAPGKWSVREIAGHIVDTELILLYRSLRFARNDQSALTGFDENLYIENSNYHELSLATICLQLDSVRRTSIAFFNNFSLDAFDRIGIANNNKVSVRALLFFIIGHQYHHLEVIKQLYLNG
jgi:uncharacterized damage-inducible protein DinB